MKITQSLFNQILKKKYLFEKKPKIAVAVSGGPDSMALVFLLHHWLKNSGGSLVALIVDHQIRKESHQEAIKTKNYLLKNNIVTKIFRINKNKVLKKTMNEARQNRFLTMLKYCVNKKFFYLFFGHHYNDNIETFLLRKIAGSNFEGLRAMQDKTIRNNIQILRPLLTFDKSAIINYNKSKKIQYIEDPSNNNINYSRVIIRKFLSVGTDQIKNIERDFFLIQKYYPFYKKMIFQILNKINKQISKNNIIINFNDFIYLDEELQIKIIEIIYKFLMPKRNLLRYAKVLKILNKFSNKSLIKANLAGMQIDKSSFYISFKS